MEVLIMNTKLSTILGILTAIIFSIYGFIDLEVFKTQTYNDFSFGATICLSFGVFFGLACGLILDVSGGSALFWHTVMLMTTSYLAGRVLTNWIRQSLLSAISLSVCLYIIGECLHVLLLYVFTGSAGFLTVFTAAIPSALLSSILSIPFAVLLRHIHRKHSEA